MEDYLPRPSGRYLKTILGSVNMSILDKEAKYQYKEQYEQFKLIVMLIGKAKSNSNHSLDLTNINVSTFRLVQCLFVFLNGQNIKIGSIRIVHRLSTDMISLYVNCREAGRLKS